ncbi:MAG: hypothetical protein ACXADY_13350 [Candidatus Hodarchaeales archaeon]|jgi:hypothetical protein
MKKNLIRINILSILIIVIVSMTLVVNPIAGAIEDENVVINLSSEVSQQSLALVPAHDYTSLTIDSTRPANISWRNHDNSLIDEFNVLSVENASVEFPINVANDINPVTSKGKINYAETSWLIFNSTSSDSYGEYIVGVNHTAVAIADDDTWTGWVDPDFNFHLRVVVGSAGLPISIRLNTFPEKNPNPVGSRYDNVQLFDPNGAVVDYYRYTYGDDEYFIFIAESKGNYALIFDPVSQPLFFDVESRSYEPETLTIEEEVKPNIKGLTDSELTEEEKENNPLTFDWFKFTAEKDQITYTHYEVIRGTTDAGWFTPSVNNTVYGGSPGVSVGKAEKRSDYILVIHDGLSRYLIGVEGIVRKGLETDNPEETKFRAQEYRAYNISVSTATSLRLQLNSESAGVIISEVYSKENNVFITSTQAVGGTIRVTNLFATGNFILILHNSLMKEAWAAITIERNNQETSGDFKEWSGMTDPANPNNPNVYKDGEKITLEKTDILGVVETQVYHFSSSFTDERFFWQILYGVAFNDSNDLIAQHQGQDIDVAINIDLFTVIEDTLQHISLADTVRTISNDSVFAQGNRALFFPLTMTSDTGDYWITIDSFMSNGTALPYENTLRFDVYDTTGFYYDTSQTVTINESIGQIQNFEINTSNYPRMIVKVPVTWMDWTEVEINYINGTISDSTVPIFLVDIPNYFEYFVQTEARSLSRLVHENPISYNEIGNMTTAFGSATYRDYVFLRFYIDSFAPNNIMSFNMTFRRFNSTILNLQKEVTVKPARGAAPGFEWVIGLLGLGTLVILATRRKRRISRK